MSASRMREKMAARNGPRHSVYWVQAKKPSEGRLATFTDVMESSNMAASAPKVEYKVVGKYTGNWRDGKKHGYGSLVYSNGSKYEGEWRDGERHGRGVYWVEEGKKLRKQYAGEWEHDKRHGVGTFFYQNGARFEGLWVHNKREGSGRMEYADDQGVYEGEWLGNQRSGRGSLTLGRELFILVICQAVVGSDMLHGQRMAIDTTATGCTTRRRVPDGSTTRRLARCMKASGSMARRSAAPTATSRPMKTRTTRTARTVRQHLADTYSSSPRCDL